MANTWTTRAGKTESSTSRRFSIDTERKKVRALQIIFGLFSLILILLTVLSMAASPGVKSFASLV